MGTFTMPSLGADMEAGTLVEWLKRPGDAVKRGDIVAVVETEKGAIEIEIFEDGRIERLLVEPGAKVPVGTALAIVAGEGSEPTAAPVPRAEPAPEPARLPAPAAAAPPAMPARAEAGPRASPAARKLAADHGVDLTAVTGTGPSGTITRDDVARLVEKPGRRAAPDLAPMRRAIAAAMARSKREIPHYYLSHDFDISAALEAVDTFNASRDAPDRILLGALLVKAVALALRDFPELNGFCGADGYHPGEAIHIGVAISLRGGGLVAPAIHDTDRLPVPELMAKMHDLVGRVRSGGFRSSELADPTVTVSSLGDRGVDSLWPVIYPPQVAIVGFGAPRPRPWATDDRVEIRPVISATLAADHRVSDGHRGALFLRRIEALLQDPEGL
ncbi:MAG: dihydrolipoamide acetyltransferase family protein [Allosphingosinicella sp.]